MTNAGRLSLRWGLCHTASFAFFVCFCVLITLLQSHDPMWFNIKYLSEDIDNNRTIQSLQPCDCSRRPKMLSFVSEHSSCSDHATSRGPHQNVVSYTIFGNTSSLYFQGIELTAKAVVQSYPGWTMRLYHNFNMSEKHEADKVCEIWCKYHHLDLCDATDLPFPLNNQSNIFGTIWRFFVLGDPLVDKFMVRDIDSPITDREVAAVNEWLDTNNTFHIMRDHPFHWVPILAGKLSSHARSPPIIIENIIYYFHSVTIITQVLSQVALNSQSILWR